MKTFFTNFKFIILLGCLLTVSDVVFSQLPGAPQAFKYQAVIRDIDGAVLAGKTMNVRISLRVDNAVNGAIVYQETHRNVTSNVFGMLHLEIGRGNATNANTFGNIDWANHPLFVQIEVEVESGSGYTSMGSGELLSVPYALYAENGGSSSVSYDHLDDTFLPKYDQVSGNLVNSSISQAADASIQISTPSLKIYNPSASANGLYVLPSVCGLKNQVLSVKDETTGILGWSFASGGGGSGNDPRLGALTDRRIPFWNDILDVLEDSPLEYTAASGMRLSTVNMTIDNQLSVQNGLLLNGNLSGNNNILLNDLPSAHVFIGNQMNKAQARILSGDISINDMGVVSLTEKDPKIAFTSTQNTGIIPYWDSVQGKLVPAEYLQYQNSTKQLSLKEGTLFIKDYAFPEQKGAENQVMTLVGNQLKWTDKPHYTLFLRNDSLVLDSSKKEISILDFGSYENLWEQKNDYAYLLNKEIDGKRPSSFLFLSTINQASANIPIEGAGTRFMWFGEKSALRAGTALGTEWDNAQVGQHSSAFGLNTEASGAYSFVIGANSKSTADNSFVLGYNNDVAVTGGFAIGSFNTIPSTLNLPSMTIGKDNTVAAPSSLALGRNISIRAQAENSLVLGSSIETEQPHSLALLVGDETNKILRGNDGQGSVILIGKAVSSKGDRIINMGFGNNLSADDASNAIAIGHDIINISKKVISIGHNLGSDYSSEESLLLGFNYKLGEGTHQNIVIGNGAPGEDVLNTTLQHAHHNVLIGNKNKVSGNNSASVENTVNLGFSINNNKSNTLVFGQDLDLTTQALSLSGTPLLVVGNGSYALQLSTSGEFRLSGDAYARSFVLSSDIRFKEAIKPLFYTSSSILKKLQGVSYILKDDETARTRFGFIAQEVQETFPSLVHKNPTDGMLSVDYVGFIPVLWELLKIQEKELDKKDAEIEALKKEIQKIKAHLHL